MSESKNTLGDVVDAVEQHTDMLGSVLNLLAARIPTREERDAEEEQRAWDMYAANVRGTVYDAAERADLLLEERRKRFGAGKEAQSSPGKVLVPAGVLLGAADLLENGGLEEHRKASALALRALVSE